MPGRRSSSASATWTPVTGGPISRPAPSTATSLLWVVAAASLMAIVMQILAARLGVVTGKDLAQACRDYYPRWTRWPNWLACEAAIAACDLAEVLGSAVAIHSAHCRRVPLFWAVIITAFDVLLLLALQGLGMRLIEAVILALVVTIGGCYFIELFVIPATRPDFAEMGRALISPGLGQTGMVTLAIGIIGATVMPHNLYLHSALVQSRRLGTTPARPRRAIRFNTIDTVLALSAAFLVNAAILVLAAIVFHGHESLTLPDAGEVVPADESGPNRIGSWSRTRHWPRCSGTAAASTLFAVALLGQRPEQHDHRDAGRSGRDGRVLHWRVRPWVRRIVTRLIAILPAILVIGVRGDGSVTDCWCSARSCWRCSCRWRCFRCCISPDRGRGWADSPAAGFC